jgi:hypothetical protein
MNMLSIAITDYNKSKQFLTTCILNEIDKEARKVKITEMDFSLFTNFFRKGKRVTNKKISKLEDLYLELIDKTGIYRLWNDTNGWVE